MKLKKPSKVMSWFKYSDRTLHKQMRDRILASFMARDRNEWASRHDGAAEAEQEGDDLALEDTETEEQRRARRERFEAMYGEKLKGVTDVRQILKILYPDQGAP